MYHLKKFAFTALVFTLAMFSLGGVLVLNVFAEPKVDVSPTCGPADPGFNIVINANGFKANSTCCLQVRG